MTYACAPPNTRWYKDPADVAPYAFEWDDYLDTGETITAATVDVATGLTKLGEQITGPHVVFKVSGGTAGTLIPNRVDVTCTITTSAGNVWQTTKPITIRERES